MESVILHPDLDLKSRLPALIQTPYLEPEVADFYYENYPKLQIYSSHSKYVFNKRLNEYVNPWLDSFEISIVKLKIGLRLHEISQKLVTISQVVVISWNLIKNGHELLIRIFDNYRWDLIILMRSLTVTESHLLEKLWSIIVRSQCENGILSQLRSRSFTNWFNLC